MDFGGLSNGYCDSAVIHYYVDSFFKVKHSVVFFFLAQTTLRSLINDQGRLFIFEKNSTLVALIAAWSLIFFKVLTLLVSNCIQKKYKVLGIFYKSPNKVGNKQLCNGLNSIKRLNTQDLGIVSYLNLDHCLLIPN